MTLKIIFSFRTHPVLKDKASCAVQGSVAFDKVPELN